MKWVAAGLLVVNVVIYLWAAGGAPGAAPAASDKPDVNAEAMQLVHEIPAPEVPPSGAAAVAERRDSPPAALASAGESAGGRGTDIEPSGLDAGTALAGAAPPGAGRSCHRIGPFKGGAGWSAANRWMSAQHIDYRAIRSQRRATRVIRVYLGPFDSPAAAAPAVEKLKQTDYEYFVEPGSADGETYISLGYFTQEALAAKYLAHLLSRSIRARSRDDYRDIGPYDWMEASIDTAARRNLLLSRRWSEQGTVVVEVDCREISPSQG